MKYRLSVIAFAALGSLFGAAPADAQETDGAAPPTPGEPVDSSPSGEPPPAAPATPAPPAGEPAKDTDATPAVEPAKPSPAPVFLQLRRQTVAAPGAERADSDQEPPDDGELRHHQDHWIGLLGVRVGRVTNPGLDPFAESDEIAQFSLGFGRTVFSAGNLSIAGLLLYDIGGRAATARGAESDLTVHRLTFGAEGRFHLVRQVFVFARGAPGVLHSIASLEDEWGVQDRKARNWVFALDLSAGAMFDLTGWGRTSRIRPKAWIGLEGGYAHAGESELVLDPDEPGNGPERGQAVNLGKLALRGPFLRAGLLVTY